MGAGIVADNDQTCRVAGWGAIFFGVEGWARILGIGHGFSRIFSARDVKRFVMSRSVSQNITGKHQNESAEINGKYATVHASEHFTAHSTKNPWKSVSNP